MVSVTNLLNIKRGDDDRRLFFVTDYGQEVSGAGNLLFYYKWEIDEGVSRRGGPIIIRNGNLSLILTG